MIDFSFSSFNFADKIGFQLLKLQNQQLHDSFFSSFSLDYPQFDSWFFNKSSLHDNAFFFFHNSFIHGFIKLKIELPQDNFLFSTPVIKISSFKLTHDSTLFSNQFLFLLHFYADKYGFDYIYATCFPKHKKLINKFLKFGYYQHSISNGEIILIKKLNQNVS